MRLPTLLVLLVFSATTVARGQRLPRFDITVTAVKVRKSAADFKPASAALYEDETYSVSASCLGEFGGSLFFKHKQTGISYTCAATCAVAVVPAHGRYIVSNTLAHMAGFAQVLEIADPQQLKAVPPATKKSGRFAKPVVAQGELSNAGTSILADSIGLLISGSFPVNDEVYHILTDFRKTYLAKVANGKFITVAQVADFSTWSYEPTVVKTADRHYILFYKNDKAEGYIDVHNTRINIFRYL